MVSTTAAVDLPPAPESILWLTSAEQLDQWLERVSGQPLALDTEFERVNTFYPVPGLVQLGAGSDFYLVDPEVAENSARFRDVLADPAVPKLLYAMSEDLELFRHWLGVEPRGVIDLQIGAAMAGEGFSVGYARLVEALFGETLDKSATRSDWLKRPLSEAQQRYAIEDIRFLEPLHRWVVGHLQQRGLEQALKEESSRFAEEQSLLDNPARHYLKLRAGWTLNLSQQLVLRDLVLWREAQCQKLDRPRNRVLADSVLITIAEQMPTNQRALSSIEGLPAVVVRKYGDIFLELVNQDRDVAMEPGFERIAPPLTREQQGLFKKVKQHFKKSAENADVPIELLAPRKRLEKVIQDGTIAKQDFFQGWRAEILAPLRGDIEELLRS
ncbi:HRDC domain-containing protein [Marinobacter salinisoli]|uniref:HRDC domain-containing protein n=1 Tax=Marinobacter salinisoli TaxID=2769486 RepID=A0ABX7MN95_9GAMM|nr:HRDC domain-containing protein [Marinobacter salinisoli]QSP93706.1 HRDC domain-containing protein [Marinobacter salinisoli]